MSQPLETRIIPKAALAAWVERLRATHRVLAPGGEAGRPDGYAPLGTEPLRLDGPRPVQSMKRLLLPQTETLFAFRGAGPALVLELVRPETAPTVILGVRPCDARAAVRLDDVFLGRKERDGHYQARREASRLVGLACAEPGWGCFCTSVGGSPAGTEGLDLLLTDLGERYHVAVLTPAGQELIAAAESAPASPADTQAALARQAEAAGRMAVRFDLQAALTKVRWEAPIWAEVAQRCLGCGVCSFLCPACHCFDIQDQATTAEGGIRFRCWDTCQQGEFTRMGAGHNPRPGQTERTRQRVAHKFQYLVEEFGRAGCTGCGRCVEQCPVHVDLREILRAFAGEAP